MESSLAVANYFINKSLDTGRDLTPMHILKLTYISHGWYLGIKERPLINEAVEAWKYGPVVQSVYHKFKSYGGNKITSLGTVYTDALQIVTPMVSDFNTIALLNKVYSVYGNFTALQLSSLTHQPNTPWDITFKKSGDGAIIPNELIMAHYKDKLNKKASGE